MVDTNELLGVIAKNKKTQTDVAKMIGVSPKTFYLRMQKGVFGSDEIQIMIDELHIDNPMEIFFAKKVT
ncbi:MAG: helix-turn-helix domain-containing protein [Roseburia sp.]|nr:helix-turn-helix domain-containing protein [Roseburia sp.]